MAISIILVIAVIITAFVLYVSKNNVPGLDEHKYSAAHRVLYDKYYVDEIYTALIVKPILWLSTFSYAILDLKFVDGLVSFWGEIVKQCSSVLKHVQNGNISYYLFAMVVGIIALLLLSGNSELFSILF
jgi:NADH-quinone oxidoreductase subunit L